jgi:hypothetical protein
MSPYGRVEIVLLLIDQFIKTATGIPVYDITKILRYPGSIDVLAAIMS